MQGQTKSYFRKGEAQPFFSAITLCIYLQHFAEMTECLEAFKYITLKKAFNSDTRVKNNNKRKFKRKTEKLPV